MENGTQFSIFLFIFLRLTWHFFLLFCFQFHFMIKVISAAFSSRLPLLLHLSQIMVLFVSLFFIYTDCLFWKDKLGASECERKWVDLTNHNIHNHCLLVVVMLLQWMKDFNSLQLVVSTIVSTNERIFMLLCYLHHDFSFIIFNLEN